jgi:hypothetical protein
MLYTFVGQSFRVVNNVRNYPDVLYYLFLQAIWYNIRYVR